MRTVLARGRPRISGNCLWARTGPHLGQTRRQAGLASSQAKSCSDLVTRAARVINGDVADDDDDDDADEDHDDDGVDGNVDSHGGGGGGGKHEQHAIDAEEDGHGRWW